MSYKLKNIKISPIKGAKNLTISSGYGKRTLKNKTKFHKALDITNGIYIVAVADGTVTSSRNTIKGYSEKNSSGNYVKIKHNSGIITTYCHMKYGSLKVKTGSKVKKGDILGVKGATGYVTGPHSHFAVKVGSEAVDPTPYLIGEKNFDLVAINKKDETTQLQDYIIYTIKKENINLLYE